MLGAQMPLGHGRGKGEHEPADPRLFELDTELSGPGSQPVEGKSIPPQLPSSFLYAVWGSIPPDKDIAKAH